MSITIKDIAKRAGVSYSTVSKALRDSPLVKAPTKEKIISIAEELGYVPNIAARSLVQKKSYTIGVVWPTVERVANSALVTKINELLEQHSYTTLLSINKVDTAISTFNRFQVDAIIVFAESEEDSKVVKKYQSTVPILYYGIKVDNIDYPTIDVNRRLAIKLAVQYLRMLGHENIAYIGEIDTSDPLQKEKYLGYLEGMEANKLPVIEDYTASTKGLDVYAGYLAAKSTFTNKKEISAVISGSFDLTRGVLRAAQELELEIPTNLSVVSYDNIPQTDSPDLQFTKVGVPLDRIAEQITQTLLEIIEGETIDHSIILNPELNIGASCSKK